MNPAEIRAWTAANVRARREYQLNPSEFHQPKYCRACLYLVTARRCEHCRAVMRMRAHLAALRQQKEES